MSEDILCRKLFVAFEASNYLMSNRSYVKTEESVKTEWDVSYHRTTVVRKGNVTVPMLASTVRIIEC